MADQNVPVRQTVITMADFVRSVMRCWHDVGETPKERAIAVFWAQLQIETGGASCFNYNIGNVKKRPGDGYDYHMLRGVWEGVSPAEAQRLVASGRAVMDPSANHAKAVGASRVSVIFTPPDQATWFRAFPNLDAGMSEHLEFLRKKYGPAWQCALDGDYVAFAHALRARGYFTAAAEAYAAGMRRPFEALVSSTTYEDVLSTQATHDETIEVEIPAEQAFAWDREDQLERYISVMHQGATSLITADLLADYRRRQVEGE